MPSLGRSDLSNRYDSFSLGVGNLKLNHYPRPPIMEIVLGGSNRLQNAESGGHLALVDDQKGP
jgi:hypothetical protein